MQTQNWHQHPRQMEQQLLGSKEKIGGLIKPNISAQPLDDQRRLQLKCNDYTMND